MNLRKFYILILCVFAANSFGLDKMNLSMIGTPEYALSEKVIEAIALSSDGKQMVYVVSQIVPSFLETKNPASRKWISQLYFRDRSGRTSVLNKEQQSVGAPAWSPDDSVIAYLAPGEKYQSLWIINPITLKTYKLLELNRDIKTFQWSHNGQQIAFVADDDLMTQNKRKNTVIDVSSDYVNSRIYLISVDSKQKDPKDAVPITSSKDTIFSNRFFDWSFDDKQIVYAYQSRPGIFFPMQSKLAIINLKTKETKTMAYSENHAVFQPLFSPDGKWIAFGSSLKLDKKMTTLRKDGDMLSKICVMDTQTEKTHCLAETFNQNPVPLGWNKSSTEIFAFDVYKTDGIQLYKLNINSKIPVKRFSIIDGYLDPSTVSISRNFNVMAYVYETVLTPPEIFVTSTDQFQPKQITHLQGVPQAPLGEMRTIHWKSSNNARIEGLLITPPGYSQDKSYPLLVLIHGGPPENWVKRYLGGTIHRGKVAAPICIECLLKKGFVIFEPNPRGSSYGRSFALSLFKNIGVIDYQDIMFGVDFLIQKKIANPDHLAIWGWSYGGYLVPWIISQTHRFKVAAEGAGYCDLISYSGTTDIPKLLVEYLGSPFWEDNRLYLQRSTILKVKNIKTPLLILHGDQDTRIPIGQAYELYTALHEQNKPVKMLIMKGQGHLPSDPNIILEVMKQTNVWLGKSRLGSRR